MAWGAQAAVLADGSSAKPPAGVVPREACVPVLFRRGGVSAVNPLRRLTGYRRNVPDLTGRRFERLCENCMVQRSITQK